MLLSPFRKFVDTSMPCAGRAYRFARDWCVRRKPRPTKYGFELAGDPSMASEDWESAEVGAFLELLKTHDSVIDIGANVGFYSCLAATRGKPVISFEPSARNLNFLYRNLWNNNLSSVEIFPMGLAGQRGLSRIYGFGGIASFVAGWGQAQQSKYSLVPVTTLDTIIGGRFRHEKLLIKMDVEGLELEVLTGATQTLDLNPKPTWMIEILLRDGVIPGGINKRFRETFEVFWEHGYKCRRFDQQQLPVQSADVNEWTGNSASECTNFLFFAD